MKRRTLSQRDVDEAPYTVWNSFINLIAMEDYQGLTPAQRPAHLVFWYESEVQNGGHLQYFENRGIEHLIETIEALGFLGAVSQQQVLRDAGQLWTSNVRRPIDRVDEFCDAALEGEFAAYDSRFYRCHPSLLQRMEEHLKQYQSLFVVVT